MHTVDTTDWEEDPREPGARRCFPLSVMVAAGMVKRLSLASRESMSSSSTEGQPRFKFIQDMFVSLALCILPLGHGDGWSGLSIGQNIESFGRWTSGSIHGGRS